MLVEMKIGVTWGDPSFEGPRSPCTYSEESATADYRHCYFNCAPAPDFSEALFVTLFAYEHTARICEVQYTE